MWTWLNETMSANICGGTLLAVVIIGQGKMFFVGFGKFPRSDKVARSVVNLAQLRGKSALGRLWHGVES